MNRIFTFKDCVAQDCDTFINADEFAEQVNINGELISAVMTRQTADLGGSESAMNGVHAKKHAAPLIGDKISLYFKTEDYSERLPKHSEFIKINGVRFQVINSAEMAGVTRLTLSTDRMNVTNLPRLEGGF